MSDEKKADPRMPTPEPEPRFDRAEVYAAHRSFGIRYELLVGALNVPELRGRKQFTRADVERAVEAFKDRPVP